MNQNWNILTCMFAPSKAKRYKMLSQTICTHVDGIDLIKPDFTFLGQLYNIVEHDVDILTNCKIFFRSSFSSPHCFVIVINCACCALVCFHSFRPFIRQKTIVHNSDPAMNSPFGELSDIDFCNYYPLIWPCFHIWQEFRCGFSISFLGLILSSSLHTLPLW